MLKRSVTGFAVFANAWALLIYRNVGRNFLGPASAVVVLNAVASQAESFVGMATKNALYVLASSVCKRAIGNLSRQPQPGGVEAFQETNHPLPAEGEFLHCEVKSGQESADCQISREKPIELVPV